MFPPQPIPTSLRPLSFHTRGEGGVVIQPRDFGIYAIGFAIASTTRCVLFLDITVLDFCWTSAVAVVVWEEGGGEPGRGV